MKDKKQQNFPVTAGLLDSLNDTDATWPHDPAVPKLPPMPDTDETPTGPDSFLESHFDDAVHTPAVQGVPAFRPEH